MAHTIHPHKSLHMHQQSKTNSAKNPPQHIEPQAPAQILNHSTSQGRGHSPSHWLSPLQLQVHALLLYLDDTNIFFIMPKVPVHGTCSCTGALKKRMIPQRMSCRNRWIWRRRRERTRRRSRQRRRKPKKGRRESDQEKATTNSVTISPSSTNDANVDSDGGMIISIDKETKLKQTTGPKQKTKKLLQGTASAPITFLERKNQERQQGRKGGNKWNTNNWSYCRRELPRKEKDQECQSTKLGQGKQPIHH